MRRWLTGCGAAIAVLFVVFAVMFAFAMSFEIALYNEDGTSTLAGRLVDLMPYVLGVITFFYVIGRNRN